MIRFVSMGEAPSYRHAVGDKRKPTCYDVYDGERWLGKVYSRSAESWEKSGRIRTRMIGYSRYWEAIGADGMERGRHHRTRTEAANTLFGAQS